MGLKLLSAALEKHDYILAAHVLVYGLLKASVERSRNTPAARTARKRYGSKRKKQEKE